jgi:phytoene synthase
LPPQRAFPPVAVPVDHYENFPVASLLLPSRLREPVAAIYWFAREADDIADEGDASPAERQRRLGEFRTELDRLAIGEEVQTPLFRRLGATVATHGLPLAPLYDLLDAFCQDTVKHRYADFAELRDYCRRSADPVGRLLLRLYRQESAQQLAWSDAICTGLQLINHWQDVAVDWQKGRIYLPRDSLERFGVDEAQIAAGVCDQRWRALLGFEVDRARQLILSGRPLGRSLPGRIGMELRLIVAGGLRILDKIERAGYDVFRRRPVLQALDWPLLLLRAA